MKSKKEFAEKEIKLPGILVVDTPGHAAFMNLRKRGGAVADIAILVIDVTAGTMPITWESVRILRERKTPFVIAANKIDRITGWKSKKDADFLDSVVAGMNLEKGSKILDIGTGWGFMAITLALHGYKVITGEPETAKWADWKSRAKIANVESKITFKPFYAEDLPFEDSTFDAVFLYTSLHHIDKKAHAIAEILRVLKNDGYLIIIELTEKGVEAIRQRKIYHPDAIDPRDFTKGFNLKEKLLQSKYLNAYIYNHKHKN